MVTAAHIQEALAAEADPAKAAHLQGFFKTGKGQYGEGDLFRGIRVPVLRKIAKRTKAVSLTETITLLKSAYHEDRFVALVLLTMAFAEADDTTKSQIYRLYLSHTQWINNWDLVDTSAHKIVGPYLENRDRSILLELARSSLLWERRIAIISTLHYIKSDEYGDTIAISTVLLRDPEPLIHKAVGWMLREVGKRNLQVEEDFLQQHYRSMPRTMLRYAIERFHEPIRKAYLEGRV